MKKQTKDRKSKFGTIFGVYRRLLKYPNGAELGRGYELPTLGSLPQASYKGGGSSSPQLNSIFPHSRNDNICTTRGDIYAILSTSPSRMSPNFSISTS
jgi:hypothetical protein